VKEEMAEDERYVKLPLKTEIASTETIVCLMALGYLEVGENGLTTPTNKKSLPPTANQSRDR